jgi:hypothetical protein
MNAMKAEVASQGAESGTAAATGPVKPGGARERAVTTEEPVADEDDFKEIPTVANHPLPAADAAPDASSSQQEGIGTYRLLRPAVSNAVDTPAPTPRKGVVLGAARKPR